jgi:hypothetical protein
VRRSKVDRVPVDSRGGPELISVEVYVPAREDGRGAGWSGWKYLGLGTVAVALIAAGLLSTVSPSGVRSRSASSATPFSVKDSRSPPRSDRYMVLLLSHPNLLRDAEQLMHQHPCAVSRSAALELATETLYAQAVANAKGEVLPGRAKLQATTYPTC